MDSSFEIFPQQRESRFEIQQKFDKNTKERGNEIMKVRFDEPFEII